MTKSELREKMKEIRNHLPKEEQHRSAEEILRRLTGMGFWSECTQLFTYLSFGAEVDTWRIVKEALNGGMSNPKEVYVPRVEGKSMNFYRIKETSILLPSKFGVPEPDGSNLIPYKAQLPNGEASVRKLMLLPGLAFDLSGSRIGYGAGYYDGYLKGFACNHFTKIAVAYDFQIQERVPAENHDIRMDYIVTPERIIHCQTQLSSMPK